MITYTLTVSNLGPAGNGLVYITNTYPANLGQITNVVQSQGTYYISNNVIVFSLGTVAANQSVTVTYSATALSLGDQYQNATNIAFVTSTDFDTNLFNNYATNVVTILGEDLGVTISASSSNVNIGDTITYTVNVTNSGPSSSGIVTLTNILSSNLGQISLVLLPPGSGSVSQNVIAFNMGELAANQGVTIIYTAVALSVNAAATNAVSTVSVSSTDFDTNLLNNSATAIVTINGEDLALGLSQSVAIIPTGQAITYTDYVTNFGPSTTGIINVTNTLSTNLSAVTVLQAPGPYTINGNTIVFQLGAFNTGQTASLVFTAIPTSAGIAINSAVVGSTDFDTNLLNNSAQVTATVVVPSSLVTNFSVTTFASAAALVWDTPFNTTAQVTYGLTSNYGNITSLSGPATHHVILLTGLVRNTNYYFNAMSWGEGVFYSTNGSFATVDTLILNTIDAAYSGSWLQGSPAITGFYGNYFNVANTTPYNPTASATYTPMIPTPGFYNVSAWYPQSTNFSTNAQMFISGATNVIIASVNQTTNGGNWRPVATNLYFASGTGGNVTIYNDTGESNKLVVANAMMWSYNNSQDYSSNGIPPAWWSTLYFGTNTAAANSNFAAYVFGTPPYDPEDTPDYWLSFPASNTVMVTFAPYQGGRTYLLQTTTNLSNPNWLTLTNQPTVATNAVGLYTNGTGYGVFIVTQTNAAQFFFRLSAQLIQE
jgi:uncharacterized repeat protein (TIGR01451 family)